MVPQQQDTQQSITERALERAHQAGIEICARGWRKTDGARVLGVTSASEDNLVHMVTVYDLRLECDCQAAKHGKYCTHRAVVHDYLVAERFERSNRTLEEKERALHRAARTLEELERKRDHAPLLTNSRPISVFR